MGDRYRRWGPWGRKAAIALFAVGIALTGCVENRSDEPELVPWVGQTVILNSTYKVCISFAAKDKAWWEHFFDVLITTSYTMQDAQYELACRQDHNALIATLPPGTPVEVVKFEHHQGWLSAEGNRQAILRIEVPDYEPSSLLVKIELYSGDDTLYDFPWEPLAE